MTQAAMNSRGTPSPAPGQAQNGSQLAGQIFLLVVLLAMGAGGWMVLHWMADPQRLPVSQLVLTGERHYTRDDDIRQAILALGQPGTFMSQDVNIIQRQIEHLPWIKQVSVRKQWPNELKIHLVEYVPVARWDAHNLVDSDGNVFSVPDDRLGEQRERLPQLSGPLDSQKQVLAESLQMGQALAAAHFQLQAAAMTARHSWQITLNDGLLLNLGREDRMRRLARFIVLYPVLQQQSQQSGRPIAYVDLRYDTGAAVGWGEAEKRQQQPNNAQATQ